MRTSALLVITSLLALACAEEPTIAESAPRPTSVAPAARVDSEPAPALDQVPSPDAVAKLEPAPLDPEPAPLDPEPPAPEPESEPEPADPLAPILPSGPEPGSPEADAELLELLEESTLTQDEFDAAFRKNKPKIEGDQFVFGAGDRTRKRPVVSLGKPKIEGSTITAAEIPHAASAAEISALAKAHLRGYESCLAVALTENPELEGSATLHVRFDAKGDVSTAKVDSAEGGAVGASLRECLAAVAKNWSLEDAAGASVELVLKLSSE